VAALRSAGGLLRRGSGQLKVGLLVLGLVREQQCNAPVRTGSRSWTSLTTTARTLSWSFMAWPWCWRRWRILAQVLELALCQVHRQVREPLLELRAPLVRQLPQVAEPAPRPVPLNLLLELRVQLGLLDRTPL